MDFYKYREHKGKEMFDFPIDYCVIDIETTGLDPNENEIIEIGAIKVRNKEIISEYQTLVKPEKDTLSEKITDITGITSDMIKDKRTIKEVVPEFDDFIKGEILLGHNVNFDINFLYDNYERKSNLHISNDYVDLLKISRKISPEFENHKLETLLKKFDIKQNQAHRAVSDCIDAYNCFEKYRNIILEQYGDIGIYKTIFNV
ncbi:3'-5' exonuclease [Anaerofustis sp.]|uniref:3'-5' exonuclease n=1 Tax=Anaerofustis sp. TaxID=1872517 RepID=UPI0025BC3C38|nr:3'-5' exonuclease [Anaerofustis sp.]